MTRRERVLLRLLLLLGGSAVVLVGLQAYLDEVARLDQRFVLLQKQAAQLQTRMIQSSESKVFPAPDWQDAFWPPEKMPDPLNLANTLKVSIDQNGVKVLDFQVLSSTARGFILKYSLEGTMEGILTMMYAVSDHDPRLLVRKLNVVARGAGIHRVDWEVAYAVLP